MSVFSWSTLDKCACPLWSIAGCVLLCSFSDGAANSLSGHWMNRCWTVLQNHGHISDFIRKYRKFIKERGTGREKFSFRGIQTWGSSGSQLTCIMIALSATYRSYANSVVCITALLCGLRRNELQMGWFPTPALGLCCRREGAGKEWDRDLHLPHHVYDMRFDFNLKTENRKHGLSKQMLLHSSSFPLLKICNDSSICPRREKKEKKQKNQSFKATPLHLHSTLIQTYPRQETALATPLGELSKVRDSKTAGSHTAHQEPPFVFEKEEETRDWDAW